MSVRPPRRAAPVLPPVPVLPALALAGLVLAGCSGGEAGSAASVARDSAGVRVVTSSAPAWAPGQEWRLGEEPLVDIGSLDGPPEAQLYRVGGAARLPDGRIVIANGPRLLWFDADGTYLFSAGGAEEGSGPGELAAPAGLAATADGDVMVFDFRNRRVSRFGPDGAPLGDTPFDVESGAFPAVIGFTADGTVVYYVMRPSRDVPDAGQVIRDSTTVVIAPHPDADSGRVEIGPVPGSDRVRIAIGGNVFPGPPAIGHRFQAAVGADAVYVGNDAQWEIRRYGLDGTLQLVFRRTGGRLEMTEEDIDSLHARMVRSAGDNEGTRQYLDAVLEATPRGGPLPAFAALTSDAAGDVWVRPMRHPGDPADYLVFAPDGTWLGTVAMPERFFPLEVGEDYVLGGFTDEMDVMHVRLYALEKPGA